MDNRTLTPAVFHILLVLADRPRHGYGIMRRVEELSKGHLTVGPGTLYRSIQRMLVNGLIEESEGLADSDWDDERRRYYRLTLRGWQVGREEARRLARLVQAAEAQGLLEGFVAESENETAS